MTEYLVFSLVGPDRTGLVDRLTEAIANHGGNLEDSRMSVLGGEFAVMVLVSVPSERSASLEGAMHNTASDLGMQVLCRKTTHGKRVQSGGESYTVSVRGMDHEGIVHDVVHVLATQGISVESLESRTSPGPFTGASVFSMDLRVLAPAAVSLVDIRSRLADVADRLNVDVEVREEAVEPVA